MDIKKEVISARIDKGWTFSMIYDTYGVPKSTAQGWIKKHYDIESDEEPEQTPYDEYKRGYVNENLQRDKPKKPKKSEEEILEFLSQLAPIQVNSGYTISTTKPSNLSNYAVVGSDFHFGCHDESAINVFLETINELRPSTIILNGDTMDMLAISRYPKDIKKHWSLLDERKAYHLFLDDLISISGGAKIYETYSNHSGQSIGGRWRRYISERLGELGTLPEIVDTLSYENVFMGDYQKYVEHVDFVELNSLVVTHGTTVRSNGGASCLGEVNKWKTSVLHGHTHRLGSSAIRVPSVGNRVESQLYGFEGGALCSLDAAYGSIMNWQQGFNIVSLDDNGVDFGVEPVMINRGSACVSTLGRTIYSS